MSWSGTEPSKAQDGPAGSMTMRLGRVTVPMFSGSNRRGKRDGDPVLGMPRASVLICPPYEIIGVGQRAEPVVNRRGLLPLDDVAHPGGVDAPVIARDRVDVLLHQGTRLLGAAGDDGAGHRPVVFLDGPADGSRVLVDRDVVGDDLPH